MEKIYPLKEKQQKNIEDRQVELACEGFKQQAEINDKQQIQLIKEEFLQLDVSSDSSQELEQIREPSQLIMFQQQNNQNQVENFQQQQIQDLGEQDYQKILYESIILIEKFNYYDNKQQVEIGVRGNEKQFPQQNFDMEFQKLDDSSDSNQEFERIETPELEGRFQQQNPNQFDNCQQENKELLSELDDQQNLSESILLIENFNQNQFQLIQQVEEQQQELYSDYLQKKAENNSQQKNEELTELEKCYNYMESIILVEKFKQNQVQKFNKEQNQDWNEDKLLIKEENIKKSQNNENEDEQKNGNSNCTESIILVEKYNQKNQQNSKQVLQQEDRMNEQFETQIRNQQKKERKLLKEQGEQGMLVKEK